MSIAIDANVLIALFHKDENDDRRLRVKSFIDEQRKKRTRLFIPTPVLCEFSVKASDKEIDFLHSQPTFRLIPFDGKAAIECSILMRSWVKSGSKSERHVAKFDMQIVAILKASGADTLVSGDKNLRNRAEEQGLKVLDIFDLALPKESAQADLFTSI